MATIGAPIARPSATVHNPMTPSPTTATRYWGLTQQEYYKKAGVWPLDPEGEVLVMLMIEDTLAIENLDDILAKVPGIRLLAWVSALESDDFARVPWWYRVTLKFMTLFPPLRYMAQYHRYAF